MLEVKQGRIIVEEEAKKGRKNMVNTAVVRKMGMKEFKGIRAVTKVGVGVAGGKALAAIKISPQRLALRGLKPGKAIVLKHTKAGCPRNGSNACSLTAMVRHEKKTTGRNLVSRHLPDGNIAVACLR